MRSATPRAAAVSAATTSGSTPARVVGEDETVRARRERAGQLGHPGPQPPQFVEYFGRRGHQLAPLGTRSLPFKGPPAHP